MTLRTDIQAIRDDPALTDAEKRQACYDLKGQAIVDLFAPRVGQTLTRGVYTLTLLKLPRYLPNRTLEFYVKVTKNGLEVPLDLPILIVNPPILVPDGAGGFVQDVLQAVRDVIMDLVR